MTEFVPFPKIARLKRGMVITEKLDGTNACVHIFDDGTMKAASRTRWITPEEDNYGFAAWVRDHEEELRGLGPGAHFGEWWGSGIQRRYNVPEKRFSLFNTSRWLATPPPACCHVVPVLYSGDFDTNVVEQQMERLRNEGSIAAPGFMKPEGVIIYLSAARVLFKRTLEKDDEPKGKSGA